MATATSLLLNISGRSPYRSPFSTTGSTPTKPARPADASATSSPDVQGHSIELCPDTEVQATISGLEKAGVGERRLDALPHAHQFLCAEDSDTRR